MLNIGCLLLLNWTIKRCVNCRQLPFFYWAWKCTPTRNLHPKRRARKRDTRNLRAKREYTYTFLTSCLTSCAHCLRNGKVRSRYCCIFKKRFLVEEMCYFMVNSWRLRFGALELRFWLKTNSFAELTRVFFSQTSTRVHQILTSTHNHEVTPYSVQIGHAYIFTMYNKSCLYQQVLTLILHYDSHYGHDRIKALYTKISLWIMVCIIT